MAGGEGRCSIPEARLWSFLVLKAAAVRGLSPCFFQNDLANGNSGIDVDRDGAGVEKLQHLFIGNPRLDKAGADVYH